MPLCFSIEATERSYGELFILLKGEIRNTYKVFFSESEGKRLFSRPGCGWKDAVKMDVMILWSRFILMRSMSYFEIHENMGFY